ncbi:hypothetical protein G8770_11665 [Aestuariicella hydrocarbonica]|uniref:Transposase DDE domain-containing protein n=1 Tax=Pseudomaricurvus hydrocarbonicus TaxID=1470433 RepID=A0A9E5ML12_9GAMM|nr:hypothetical protein [Aestuariicella hydrocarbonica]
MDKRTTDPWVHAVNQVKRKQIEECFGWMKDIGLMRKLRHVGRDKTAWIFIFSATGYNIMRMKSLMALGITIKDRILHKY